VKDISPDCLLTVIDVQGYGKRNVVLLYRDPEPTNRSFSTFAHRFRTEPEFAAESINHNLYICSSEASSPNDQTAPKSDDTKVKTHFGCQIIPLQQPTF
jgi:hypothetical protein